MHSPVIENIIQRLRYITKHSTAPKYLQLAEAMITTITHTPLPADTAVPSSRTLCTALGWHRKTVIAAQHEAEMQGYIYSIPNKGYYVSKNISIPQKSKQQSLHLDLQVNTISKTPVILHQHFQLRKLNIPVIPHETYLQSQQRGTFSFKNNITFQKISNSIYHTKAFQLQLQHEYYTVPPHQKEILNSWLQSVLPVAYAAENIFWHTSLLHIFNYLFKQLWHTEDVIFISPNCPIYALQTLQNLQIKAIPIPLKNNKLDYEKTLQLIDHNKKNIKGWIIHDGQRLPYFDGFSTIEKIQLLQAAHQFKIPIVEIAHNEAYWHNKHIIDLDTYGCSMLVKDWNFYLPLQQSLVAVVAPSNMIHSIGQLFAWNNIPVNNTSITTITAMIQNNKWPALIKKTNKQLLKIQANFIKSYFTDIHLSNNNSIFFNCSNPQRLQQAIQNSKVIGHNIHPDNILSNEHYHGIKYYFTEDNYEMLHQYFSILQKELIVPLSKSRNS